MSKVNNRNRKEHVADCMSVAVTERDHEVQVLWSVNISVSLTEERKSNTPIH